MEKRANERHVPLAYQTHGPDGTLPYRAFKGFHLAGRASIVLQE